MIYICLDVDNSNIWLYTVSVPTLSYDVDTALLEVTLEDRIWNEELQRIASTSEDVEVRIKKNILRKEEWRKICIYKERVNAKRDKEKASVCS